MDVDTFALDLLVLWIGFCGNSNSVTFFESFGTQHFRRVQEIYWQQQYHNKCPQNAGWRLNNMWILLH